MNPDIISKYRKVDWIFAVYQNIELVCIYFLTPAQMGSFYEKWERKWHDEGGKDINNPKIPLSYVVETGELLWGSPPRRVTIRRRRVRASRQG